MLVNGGKFNQVEILCYFYKTRNENLKYFVSIIGAVNPSSWHGEGGRAVVIPKELTENAKKRFSENQFNIIASDLMALNRSIRDQRSQK